jgi:hypothetical protein
MRIDYLIKNCKARSSVFIIIFFLNIFPFFLDFNETSPQQAAGYQNRIFYLNEASFGELNP